MGVIALKESTCRSILLFVFSSSTSTSTKKKKKQNTLLLDGLTPEAWGSAAWRSRVCYVPQSRLRLPGSPADLFAEASKFAAQVDRRGISSSSSPPPPLSSFSSSTPLLDSVASSLLLDPQLMHRPWETLSGGQAARAALAVAMALDPPFLLVDEPTAALDAAARGPIQALARSAGASAAFLFLADAAAPSTAAAAAGCSSRDERRRDPEELTLGGGGGNGSESSPDGGFPEEEEEPLCCCCPRIERRCRIPRPATPATAAIRCRIAAAAAALLFLEEEEEE